MLAAERQARRRRRTGCPACAPARRPWCAARALLGSSVDVDVRGGRLDVDEHRHGAVLDDRRHGRREPGGHGDDLVAGHDAALAEALADVSAVKASRLADEPELTSRQCRTPRQRGELALEALGVATVGEPEVERGVDQVAQLLGAEDAAAVRHARHPRHEVRGSVPGAARRGCARALAAPERLVVVALDERQDLGPQLVGGAHDAAPPVASAAPRVHGTPRALCGGDVAARCRRRSAPRRSALAGRPGAVPGRGPADRRRARPTRVASRARRAPWRSRAAAGRLRGAARRPPSAARHEPAPQARQERVDHLSDGHARAGAGTEVPGAVAPVAVAQQARAQPEVARQRLEHVLPRPHGAGVGARSTSSPATIARTQSGTSRSAAQSPPPITLPARGAGDAHRRAGAEEAAPVGRGDELGAALAGAVGVVAAQRVGLAVGLRRVSRFS